MEITFKLFATLGDYLPPEAKFNQVALQVKEGTSVQAVIDPFNLPPKLVHLVLLNGQYVNPEDRSTKLLQEGDVLAVWPPIAGG